MAIRLDQPIADFEARFAALLATKREVVRRRRRRGRAPSSPMCARAATRR